MSSSQIVVAPSISAAPGTAITTPGRATAAADAAALASSTTTLGRAALTSQRLLPVVAPLRTLLPGGGLRRGRAVTVRGAAALSLAMALVAEASRAGSWTAIVGSPTVLTGNRAISGATGCPGGAPGAVAGVGGVGGVPGRSAGVGGVGGGPGGSAGGRPGGFVNGRSGGSPGGVAEIGLEAVAGLGVALERVVRVAVAPASGTPAGGKRAALQWAEAMAAILDGFELVITAVPPSAVHVGRVQRRLAQREAAVIVVGDPGALDVDAELRGRVGAWEGLEEGAGHLRQRRIDVLSSGRRMPRPVRAELWLPATGGGIDTSDGLTSDDVLAGDRAVGSLDRLLLDPELDDVDDGVDGGEGVDGDDGEGGGEGRRIPRVS